MYVNPRVPPARTCVVLQPGYLPWLGFFEQMHVADEFVFLDDVQFDKHGWRNRNRIKGPGGAQWLTVPVRTGGRGQQCIHDVQIDPTRSRWAEKHVQALRTCYAPCPYFDWLFPELAELLTSGWSRLVDLDLAAVELLCGKLKLRRSVHRSSELELSGDRSGRLVEICRRLGCGAYYSGSAARDYLDLSLFAAAGIEVRFQDYAHPCYPQRFGEFISHLSVVDLLFNVGPRSLEFITVGATAGAGTESHVH